MPRGEECEQCGGECWCGHRGTERSKGNFLKEAHQSKILFHRAHVPFVNTPRQLSTVWNPIPDIIVCFTNLLIWNTYGHFKTMALAEHCDHRRMIIITLVVVTMPVWDCMRQKSQCKAFIAMLEQLNKRITWTYWTFQGILMENVFWPHETYHDYRLISSEFHRGKRQHSCKTKHQTLALPNKPLQI